MVSIPFPSADRLLTVIGLIAFCVLPARAEPDLVDLPVVWYDADDTAVDKPSARNPSLIQDAIETTAIQPVGRVLYPPRVIRNLGTLFGGDHVVPAGNVNSLDEVPNNSWFTNRLGLFPRRPEDASHGPGRGTGPEPRGPWIVVGAKTEGVTSGFTIRDGRGDEYLLKFDPPGYRGLTTGAGVIGARIMHAAGYNVPDDAIVHFDPSILELAPGIELVVNGRARAMGKTDLAAILADVPRMPDGRVRALASRILDGDALGPFSFAKRRGDDPNDRVPHPDRRELRGLRVFAAWLSHFDTKQHNTLDVYVGENGRGHVRHYLIDFASSLGAGARGPVARHNHEYAVAPASVVGRVVTLGLVEQPWRRVRRPAALREVGYLDAANFDPLHYRPQLPNSAFRSMTDRDGYWAAKIISAFTNEHLLAIVVAAEYEDPGATAYVANVLAQRRNHIARTFFDRVVPLDHFRVEGATLVFTDLGVARGVFDGEASYRSRVRTCDEDRRGGAWSSWRNSGSTSVDLRQLNASEQHPFTAVEVQVDRGEGWSDGVRVYLSQRHGVIALER